MDANDLEELIGWAGKLPDDKLNTIEDVTKLVDLVKNGATNNIKTVTKAIDKANIKGLDRERFLWLTCKECKQPDELKVSMEEAKEQMLSDLQREKQQRAKNLVKTHGIEAAINIIIGIFAVWDVWELIKSAKSEMESCNKKFDEIERLLAKHGRMADQLKRCIEEYLHSGRPEEREKMRDLTFELISDLRGTTKMIGNVQVKLKGKITSIGSVAKKKSSVLNFVGAFVSASLIYKYWDNFTEHYKLILGAIPPAFVVLGIANIKNYYSCNQTLGELRSNMKMIEQFDDEIQRIEEIIRKAEELIKRHDLREETS